MAVTQTTSAKKTADKAKEKKKLRRALLAVVLLILLLGGIGAGIYAAGKVLFTNNPRTKLHEIRVNGTGYWQNHTEELAQRIGLKRGVNLFALNLRQLRKRIMQIPNIDTCSVVRVLPDTVVIKVTERVPRAILGKPNSPWVIDSDTIVMPRRQVMAFVSTLPRITDISLADIQPGQRLLQTSCAVDLIMMTVRNFPDIRIYQISLKNPEKMEVLLRYRKFAISKVIIPVKNRGLSFMLLTLQSAIINARQGGEKRNSYDLSYDGRVVIR